MSITLLLIALTSIISWRAFEDPELRAKMIFHPVTVKNRNEYYRFLTHGFIHADFQHLLFNMYALYIFGSTAETLFADGFYYYNSAGGTEFMEPIFGGMLGRFMYLIFYLAAIAAASQVTFMRHQDNYGYSALGASGGVSAMMWPYIFYDPWNWFIFPPLPAIILGPLYLWYSNRMDQRGGGRVGHNAHLWGAIFGLLFYVVILIFRQPELIQWFFEFLQNPRGPAFL